MTDFTDTQAHRIAKLAAQHVRAQQQARWANAVADAAKQTELLVRAEAYRGLYLAAARVEETWGDLVGAVLEAEGGRRS